MIKNKFVWILAAVLVSIEQGIKLIINHRYLETSLPILKPWLYFDPLFNRDYSWFNSMLQLGVGKWLHVALVTALILTMILFYVFLKKRIGTTYLVDTAFAFILSGAVCSWIDKVFWNGSLDYIALRGFFTFDLKDVYINVFIGLLLLMLLLDHQGIRQADEKDILKGFWDFLRRR